MAQEREAAEESELHLSKKECARLQAENVELRRKVRPWRVTVSLGPPPPPIVPWQCNGFATSRNADTVWSWSRSQVWSRRRVFWHSDCWKSLWRSGSARKNCLTFRWAALLPLQFHTN